MILYTWTIKKIDYFIIIGCWNELNMFSMKILRRISLKLGTWKANLLLEAMLSAAITADRPAHHYSYCYYYHYYVTEQVYQPTGSAKNNPSNEKLGLTGRIHSIFFSDETTKKLNHVFLGTDTLINNFTQTYF